MRILVIGLGVIGSTYGYLFYAAGHEVFHLIRETSAQAAVSELEISLLDGRRSPKGQQVHALYPVRRAQPHGAYDLIFVSVSHGALAAVLETLKEQELSGTLLVACGLWESRPELERVLRGFPYILGYPVAGGNLQGGRLNACLFDHFMLEKRENAKPGCYDAAARLFGDCCIGLETPFDLLEWIWLHMAVNAAVAATAGRYGGVADPSAAAEGMMASARALSEAVLSIRETARIVASRGVKLKNYRGELLPYRLPAKLAGAVMKRMFAGNLLTRRIMTLHNNLGDLLFVCRSVYACGKRNGVAAPRFYESCETVERAVGGREPPVRRGPD